MRSTSAHDSRDPAEHIKDEFLMLISHEFRTPLTAIRGGAHLLEQQGDALDEEARRDLLRDIVAESNRLDSMLGNLLGVSEVLAGHLHATSDPVLVPPLLGHVVEDYRHRAPDYLFGTEVEEFVPPADGDPDLLVRILRNLYENALKYSSPGSTIAATVRTDGLWVAIDIQDDGVGIAPQHVAHVFERFRKPGTDPTVRGMGIGLYLSQLLVEAQHGRIRASSPGVGKGATLTVEIPVAREWRNENASLVTSGRGEKCESG